MKHTSVGTDLSQVGYKRAKNYLVFEKWSLGISYNGLSYK